MRGMVVALLAGVFIASCASSSATPPASALPSSASPAPLAPWDDVYRERVCWAFSTMGAVRDSTEAVETALSDHDLDTAYLAATMLEPKARDVFHVLDQAGLGSAGSKVRHQLWAASFNLWRYGTLVTEGITEGSERKIVKARELMHKGSGQLAVADELLTTLQSDYKFTCDEATRPPVTATPEPPPVASPGASPTPASPVVLSVGDRAVTLVDDLRFRSQPRVSDDSIKYVPTLAAGTPMDVLEGPVFASGYWWYRVASFMVRSMGDVSADFPISFGDHVTSGWVASADHDGTPWIGLDAEYGGCDVSPEDMENWQPGDTVC